MASSVTALRLGDVVTLVRGTTYKGALLGQPGPVLLGLASIQRHGGFRSDSLKTYGGECKARILLGPGDLYASLKDVTQSAELLGAVARVPTSIASGRLTQDTVKLEFIDGEYPRNLLYWSLRSPMYRSYCREHATGTTTLGLARDDFLAFPLPVPTRHATYLVELLEAIEERIQELRETNATLEAIAKALFKSWFLDFDPVRAKAEGRQPEGMDSATAALFPSELVHSELGLIPKGWNVRRLGDVIELAYGKAMKASDRRAGDVPVYGSGGITGLHDAALVEGPAVIVGRKGTVGSLYWEHAACFPIDTVFYVKPKTVSLEFTFYAMQRLGLDRMNTDAAVPGLNRENAYRVPLVVPSADVISAWDLNAVSIKDRGSSASQHCSTLMALRDILLSRLISGKVRLPEAEFAIEESAE